MKSDGLAGRSREYASCDCYISLPGSGTYRVMGRTNAFSAIQKLPIEIDQFSEFAHPAKLFAVVTITPSPVLPDTTSTPCFWPQVLWLDSAVFGGFLGYRNVAIRRKCRLERIRQAPTWISTETIRDAYNRVGLSTGDNAKGLQRITPMACPSASVVISQIPGESPSLARESLITTHHEGSEEGDIWKAGELY